MRHSFQLHIGGLNRLFSGGRFPTTLEAGASGWSFCRDRVTQWLAPVFSLIPHEPGPFVKCGGRAWVPIDDDHVTVLRH
jgi:hypothetical protein